MQNRKRSGAAINIKLDVVLKAQAKEVLQANGLTVSEAVRIFLQEVVSRGTLPPSLRRPRTITKRLFWAMKRDQQARDQALVRAGKVPPEAMFLLREERLKDATLEWPNTPLVDD